MNGSAATKLAICGVVSFAIYVALYFLSHSFGNQIVRDRPLFRTLGLFAFAFFIYLLALRFAIQLQGDVTRLVIGFALVFRIALLFSEPIQEVDIYRYLWDGLVSTQGVSPFEYAPGAVAEAQPGSDLPRDFATLVELRDRSVGVRETLSRVHYAQLPTVYPPVSQVVFAMVACVTPEDASVSTRVVVMKFALLLFDVGTMFFIMATLRHVDVHVGWSLAYAWCPLVMKEFANSGHLDAIAVFFTAAAIYCAVVGLYPNPRDADATNVRPTKWLSGGALMLALGVGAKLYPVALLPILAWSSVCKVGWARTSGIALVFMMATGIFLAPMLFDAPQASTANANDPFAANVQDRQAGLKAFLSDWMMNDLIFLNCAENLTPDRFRQGGPTPWFVLLPDATRESIVASVSRTLNLAEHRVPFALARAMTALLFLGLAGCFAMRAARASTAQRWLELTFLTMAWFWLLLPTLNPWYWIWALPWIPFARNRVWLLMSGLLFIYYLRFYFDGSEDLQFGVYTGASIFDFVVVWFEYIPWFAALVGWAFYNTRQHEANFSPNRELPNVSR